MSLQKQSIPVKFAGGVDTKTAEQLVVPGSFLRLDNCVRRKTGRIEKRNGFELLGTGIVASTGTVAEGTRLDTFKDDLLLFTSDTLYSYTEATDKWVDRGEIGSVLVDSEPLVRNSYKQAQPDVAYLAGYTVTVYEDSRTANTIRYSVFDDSTGASIVYDTLIDTSAERPRVIPINSNTFLIGYRKTSTDSLGLALISIATPSSISLLTPVEVGAFSSGPWDLIPWNQYGLAVFNTTGSATRLVPLDYQGNVGTGTSLPVPINLAYASTNAVSACWDGAAGNFYIAMATSTGLRTAVAPFSLITTYAAGSEVARTNIKNATIVQKETGLAQVFLEFGNPATVAERKNQQVSTVAVTFAAGAVTQGSLTSFKRSVGLASKAWVVDDTYYVTVAHDSALQATYFVQSEDARTVAKITPGLAGGLTQDTSGSLKSGLSSVVVDSQGRYIAAGRCKNSLQAASDGTIVSSSVGIQKMAFTFDSAEFDSETFGENFHVAGGVMLAYDGVSATELNFHLYPEDLTTSQNSSGTLPTGTYYYQAIYEWQDAKGQIHRSAPSVPISAAVTGTGNDQVIITVPTLRLTRKTGTRADCKVVLYSGTVGDDTIMYRLDETTNDTTADTVTFTDGAPRSASFILGEVLYTTGGLVESTAPPASKVTTSHKNRLWLGGLEDGLTLAYTREHVYGEGACFSDFLTLRVDPRGGSVTALGSLDDKLVIFKRDAIFSLVGDGPLDTGAQNDYGQPQLVSSDVGCTAPKSVVTTPMGLMFKTDKGIFLLDRSLGTSYIGAPVAAYNSYTVTSAVVLEDVQEVRFTTSEGPCLVYNYEFNQWSTFTNYASASACRGLDSYLHLRSTGVVCKENSSYNDAGARYSMAIETSWFSFADLQGYQRIYYIMGLGDYLSNHHTRVKMAYDFEDAYSETVYFNVDNGLDISYYGDDATYGDSDVYGGSGTSIYQWYLRPRRQKCQSIKLLIEDVDTISANGDASFNFVGLTFQAGIKSNGPRVRAGQEIGRE